MMPLLLPIRYRCDGLQLPQLDRIAATLSTRQKKHLLLDVRRQQGQIEQLGHPCAREPEPARYVGPAVNHTAVDGGLNLVRERQHDGQAGWAPNRFGRDWRGIDEPLRVAFANPVEFAGDHSGARQGLVR